MHVAPLCLFLLEFFPGGFDAACFDTVWPKPDVAAECMYCIECTLHTLEIRQNAQSTPFCPLVRIGRIDLCRCIQSIGAQRRRVYESTPRFSTALLSYHVTAREKRERSLQGEEDVSFG